jgi:hypothetical protein
VVPLSIGSGLLAFAVAVGQPPTQCWTGAQIANREEEGLGYVMGAVIWFTLALLTTMFRGPITWNL